MLHNSVVALHLKISATPETGWWEYKLVGGVKGGMGDLSPQGGMKMAAASKSCPPSPNIITPNQLDGANILICHLSLSLLLLVLFCV